MKKHNQEFRDLIYVHLNTGSQYVMSSGIEFYEFAISLSEPLNHLLLLKHRFDDGDFNMHTFLEYVPKERLGQLIKDDVYSYGDFCWLDFDEIDALDELSGQEIAELLYLGHLKQHLKRPFYSHLGNQFVYLAHEDGWFNKIYYRNINDFYDMLGNVTALKLSHLKMEKTLLGIKKKRSYPPVTKELLFSLSSYIKEGALFSVKDAVQSRSRIEIPIWVLGDYANMDDMYDHYQQVRRQRSDAKLIYDKKQKEWQVLTN
ncbi:hypothetical protein CU633_11180 [Bacillus sp. V3-13]|uniref:hypothetical protein n=1 Tax=Bacillus sp. V3-13 TaxID=2053728 RepID=UPI000C794EF6|nr:hypothetical protein [Bacillus sp. V3-13]PLR77325.1 hypothetical protein CU633_11180 [Bacillus sp. V3-13]